MARKRITADELMRELESDPEWVAKREERERQQAKHRAALDADEMELVREIRNVGYQVTSVWDLVNNTPHPHLERNFVGEYPAAYPILLKHLRMEHHPRIREGIIRALTVPDGGNEVAWELLGQFEKERDAQMKWVIANALRTVMNRSARKKYPEIDDYYKNPGVENAG
jgi:hypothetical protein